jgi:hypothetical protein
LPKVLGPYFTVSDIFLRLIAYVVVFFFLGQFCTGQCSSPPWSLPWRLSTVLGAWAESWGSSTPSPPSCPLSK